MFRHACAIFRATILSCEQCKPFLLCERTRGHVTRYTFCTLLVASAWRSERSGQGQICLFSTPSRPAIGRIQTPIERASRWKVAGRKGWGWSLTSTLPCSAGRECWSLTSAAPNISVNQLGKDNFLLNYEYNTKYQQTHHAPTSSTNGVD
jgi:hypothetical protein